MSAADGRLVSSWLIPVFNDYKRNSVEKRFPEIHQSR